MHDWNSAALAALANLSRPKLLFIVQSNGQFQINVIAKLPTVSSEVFLLVEYRYKAMEDSYEIGMQVSAFVLWKDKDKAWFIETNDHRCLF